MSYDEEIANNVADKLLDKKHASIINGFKPGFHFNFLDTVIHDGYIEKVTVSMVDLENLRLGDVLITDSKQMYHITTYSVLFMSASAEINLKPFLKD